MMRWTNPHSTHKAYNESDKQFFYITQGLWAIDQSPREIVVGMVKGAPLWAEVLGQNMFSWMPALRYSQGERAEFATRVN